ncbi:MAG: hypothetical protein E3J72_05460 [Planctomycetota bacterium]|nr:MAG: hypothetical protein E3J72_05460 [Planctomycetota bacterium]
MLLKEDIVIAKLVVEKGYSDIDTLQSTLRDFVSEGNPGELGSFLVQRGVISKEDKDVLEGEMLMVADTIILENLPSFDMFQDATLGGDAGTPADIAAQAADATIQLVQDAIVAAHPAVDSTPSSGSSRRTQVPGVAGSEPAVPGVPGGQDDSRETGSGSRSTLETINIPTVGAGTGSATGPTIAGTKGPTMGAPPSSRTTPLPPSISGSMQTMGAKVGLRRTASGAKRFGKYEIIKELSRGGMGIVYKVRHPDLDIQMALKVLLAGENATEDQVRRFYLEASASAKLKHPNIVGIHDVGIENGVHYFTLDFIDGPDLSHIMKKERLPVQRSLEIIREVSDAIEYAHQHGILHRDIKPSNIMIDKSDRPMVMDFGLAKDLGDEQARTVAGMVLGTPKYMPPEQAAGKIADLGPQADVYSLGAVLYELVTGYPPFEGKTAFEVLRNVMDTDVIPPRKRNAKVAEDVETIILMAMEKEISRRYQTAQALGDDIERYIKGEPIEARAATFWYRTGKYVKRHKLLVSIVTVSTFVILFLLGFAGHTLWKKQSLELETLRKGEAQKAQYRSYLEKGKKLALQGKAKEAMEQLAKIPEGPSEYFEAGEQIKEIKAREKRMEIEGYQHEANMALQDGELEKALSLYDRILYINPFDKRTEDQRDKLKDRIDELEEIENKKALSGKKLREGHERRHIYKSEYARVKPLQIDLDEKMRTIKTYAMETMREEIWDLKEAISEQWENAGKYFQDAYDKYREALDLDNGNADARHALLDFIKIQYGDALRQNNETLMRFRMKQINELVKGLPAEEWEYLVLATFSITTEPGNAAVFLYPIDNRGMRWLPIYDEKQGKKVGHTPIVGERRKPGNYLIEIKLDGYREVNLSLNLEPGCSSSFVVPLFTDKEIGDDFVYVPAGIAIIGGGHESASSKPWKQVFVDGFFIGEHEVTTRDYRDFLNGIAERAGPEEVWKYIPREKNGDLYKNWNVNPSNSVIVGAGSWGLKNPITSIRRTDAEAYCMWRSQLEYGVTYVYRLPEEDEWEKAARGADGRLFPWGNRFDPGFCLMVKSLEKPDIRPFGNKDMDVSPYLVHDMAGSVSEMCRGYYDDVAKLGVVRGGSFATDEIYCLLPNRIGIHESGITGDSGARDDVGFRLVKDLSAARMLKLRKPKPEETDESSAPDKSKPEGAGESGVPNESKPPGGSGK